MADPIARPVFSDGEILRADDLNTTIDLARARDARHARQAHRWGIVSGLELSGADQSGGFEVTMAAGVARDVRGREIVVAGAHVLSPDSFNVTGAEDDWFPVFLVGVDQPAIGGKRLGACAGAGGRRTLEDFEIEFGRPQEALDWEAQDAPDVDEGPDTPAGQFAARVLLGFVQWKNGNFAAVNDASPAGVRRRLAGVRGGSMESIDGTVLARVGDSAQEALAFSIEGGPPILQLDRKGNLFIQGSLQAALSGDVKVSSGVATNGSKLPLPEGVAEADVGNKVTAHAFLRPRVDGLFLTIECGVDDARRVRCRVTPIVANTTAVPGVKLAEIKDEVLAEVDYLLVVAAKGKS
jgi:hypothetical protein